MINFTSTTEALLAKAHACAINANREHIEYVEVEVGQFEPGRAQGMCNNIGVYKGPSLKFQAYFPAGGGCVSRALKSQTLQLIPIGDQLLEPQTWSSGKRDITLHGDFKLPEPTKQERVLALLAEIKKVVEAP